MEKEVQLSLQSDLETLQSPKPTMLGKKKEIRVSTKHMYYGSYAQNHLCMRKDTI